MAARDPLRLFWWKKTANFGDGISPVVLAHVSGRSVVWAEPADAEVFAVGSILRTVARTYKDGKGHRPVIWGSGCMKPVGRSFTSHVDFLAVRGPKTAEVLHLDGVPFGDPGLLIREAMGEDIPRSELIGVVPHFKQRERAVFTDVIAKLPSVRLIDVTQDDPLAVVRAIAGCRHVISSSLHGLVVADAFGLPSTWMDPDGIHAEAQFKFDDYAASIGRTLNPPVAAADIPDLIDRLGDEDIPHSDGVSARISSLKASFPQHLQA